MVFHLDVLVIVRVDWVGFRLPQSSKKNLVCFSQIDIKLQHLVKVGQLLAAHMQEMQRHKWHNSYPKDEVEKEF